MRNSSRAGAALTVALVAGCGRSPAPAPAPDPTADAVLAAPAPSSTVVTSPLGAGASSYTNEMQAQNLRDQASQLGIERLSPPSDGGGSDDGGSRQMITYQQGLDRTRELAREVEAQRHAIEKDQNRTVAIPSQTPAILSGGKEGSPIEGPEN